MARVTSWTDQGMDWDNPNLADWHYVDALASAVNERLAAIGQAPMIFPDFEGRYLNKTILQSIRNNVRTLIPNFIDHTTGNTFAARENEARWSINSISEITGIASVTFENSGMLIAEFNEHAKKLYNTINLLRYLSYRQTQAPFLETTNCDRYSKYSALWGFRESENPMLSYAHPHSDVSGWQPGTSGENGHDNGGLVSVWNDLAMSNWGSAEWGDNDVDEGQCYTFSLYSAAQSGNSHSDSYPMGGNIAWIRSWRQRGKIKMTFPTAGNASDDVIIQIWQTRQITAVRKTLGTRNYPYTTYYENTSETDNTPVLIEEITLQNNQESTEIDTQKLEVDMVDVLDRVKMADAWSTTQSIYEITRDFTVKVSMGTMQPLNFAFKDW